MDTRRVPMPDYRPGPDPIVWPEGEAKLLVWDIEAMSHGFSPSMGEILCVAFQHPSWDQPRVVRYDDFAGAVNVDICERDIYLCGWLHEQFQQAEILVGHYAYGFDRPFVTSRMMHHSLTPFVQTQEIDTYKIARKNFKGPGGRFGPQGLSCSLKNLAQFLNLPQLKGSTSPSNWRRLMTNDYPEVMAMTADYCMQDVRTTLELFNRLKPLGGYPVNLALANGQKGMRCTSCGSQSLQSRGTRTTATQQYGRYRCNDCGKWCRARTSCVERGANHLMPL